jgi:hypothetical protein
MSFDIIQQGMELNFKEMIKQEGILFEQIELCQNADLLFKFRQISLELMGAECQYLQEAIAAKHGRNVTLMPNHQFTMLNDKIGEMAKRVLVSRTRYGMAVEGGLSDLEIRNSKLDLVRDHEELVSASKYPVLP